MSPHQREIDAGERFEFGANWSRFLAHLDDGRIESAEQSLKRMLGVEDLRGKRFLDAGSGSGLFSLAARRLGAEVYSFDFDPRSVGCTEEVRRRFFPDDPAWTVRSGSVLDRAYLDDLGRFEVVYSWGVLHHTGAMWPAIDNVSRRVAPGGKFFIAIYNDQGLASRYWHAVKKAYVSHRAFRWPLLLLHMPYPLAPSAVMRIASGRRNAIRGMSLWYDFVDWIGGYPFEVATPDAIIDYLRQRGFDVERLQTTNRSGCNEFVFVKGSGQP